MNEQEEYLDKLLNEINEGPEDEALEDFSFEDVDIDEMEDIDEEAFFNEEASEYEDEDSLVLESMQQESDSELDDSEFGLNEDDFQLDEDDLDFAYEEADGEGLDPALNALFGDEMDEAEVEPEEEEQQMLEEAESEEEELQMPEEAEPEEEEQQIFEEVEPEEEEQQIFEEVEPEEEEQQIFEEVEPEEEEQQMFEEAEPEEISDAEALANILNAFSDDENEGDAEEDLHEENLTEEETLEEAILDTPEELGLELEEIMEEEEPQGKKKKAKKERKKKERRKKEDTLEDFDLENTSEKKPSLFARLLEDNADDEPTPEELEAEAAKKAEKEEKKQAKKAAAEEKKQQSKEAAAAKKAEKEAEKKRKKEMEEPAEPWPPFTKKVIPMIFLFGATLAALIIIFSNVLSYSPYLSNARKYFDNRQYEKAYDQLLGIEIKEKDWNFYSQVLLMNQLQVKVTSSKNHLLNQERALAVNDLVQAVLFYNDNLEKAEEIGLKKEFQVVYADIEAGLSETFGLSVGEAEAIGAITDAAEYQERIAEIVK